MINIKFNWKLEKIKDKPKNAKKVLSLFAGAGGSSMGYKLAGLDVIGCVEIDKHQNQLYVENLNPKYNYCEDIRDFKVRDDLPKELYELDVLDASPPCSLFSIANLKADDKKGKKVKFREGQAEQVLDDLFFETIKVIDKLKPKIAMLENVKGLLNSKNKKYVDRIYKDLDNAGYDCIHYLLNAKYFGVPQSRERVFFIATRKDIKFKNNNLFDKPVFDELLNYRETLIPFGEIMETGNNQYPLSEMMLELWKQKEQTDPSFEKLCERVLNKKNHLFGYKFLRKNKVANTVTGTDIAVLYDEPRYRSDLEVIKCGAFPQDYNFMGKNIKYCVGMSVPPVFMAKIIKIVLENLNEKNI
jgi:DNA (cytosine-5)-methyltransferase 1